VTSDLLSKVRGEIDARLAELRPHVAEYERLLAGAQALGSSDGAPSGEATRAPARPSRRRRVRTRPVRPDRAPRGAAHQAIVAALEHGSHTLSELAVVTAMPGPSIRTNLRPLLKAGAVRPAKRDGKAAYALAGPAHAEH
jgi:DNA-binding transcriptional ArsR family regulator